MPRGRPKKSAVADTGATDNTDQLPAKRTRTLTSRAADFVNSVRSASARNDATTAGPIRCTTADQSGAAPVGQLPAGSSVHAPDSSARDSDIITHTVSDTHTSGASASESPSSSATLNSMDIMNKQMQAMLDQVSKMQQMMASQQEAILNIQSGQQASTSAVPDTNQQASTSAASAKNSSTTSSAAAPTPSTASLNREATNDNVLFQNILPGTGEQAAQSPDIRTANESVSSQFTAPQPRQYITAGMPLGQSLPQKLKQDIWDDKYIDMAALLYPDSHSSFGIQICTDGNSMGELKLTPNKKRITNFTEWSKAFNSFISIYVQKPGRETEAGDLLTYMSEVQHMAECNLDWMTYDTLYRKDRAANLNPLPWSSLNISAHNHVLRSRSASSDPSASYSQSKYPSASYSQSKSRPDNSSKQFNSDNFTAGSIKVPFGFCFTYHQHGKTCKNQQCEYSHRCFKCNSHRNHPIYLCEKYSRNNQSQNYSGKSHQIFLGAAFLRNAVAHGMSLP